MLAEVHTHPLTFRYQQQRPGCDWLPDAVTDTTAKRQRGAKRLFGDGQGIISRLLAYSVGQLCHLVIPLQAGIDFYRDAPAIARKEMEQLLGQTPRYAKVSLSRSIQPHIHVLAMMPDLDNFDVQGSYGKVYCNLVETDDHLRNVARYFSRPSDERGCRPKPMDCRRYTPAQLVEQKFDASELYLQARNAAQGKPLSRLSWTTNLPRLKPDLHMLRVDLVREELPQPRPHCRSVGRVPTGHAESKSERWTEEKPPSFLQHARLRRRAGQADHHRSPCPAPKPPTVITAQPQTLMRSQ